MSSYSVGHLNDRTEELQIVPNYLNKAQHLKMEPAFRSLESTD
jgi:hypothetical protein